MFSSDLSGLSLSFSPLYLASFLISFVLSSNEHTRLFVPIAPFPVAVYSPLRILQFSLPLRLPLYRESSVRTRTRGGAEGLFQELPDDRNESRRTRYVYSQYGSMFISSRLRAKPLKFCSAILSPTVALYSALFPPPSENNYRNNIYPRSFGNVAIRLRQCPTAVTGQHSPRPAVSLVRSSSVIPVVSDGSRPRFTSDGIGSRAATPISP